MIIKKEYKVRDGVTKSQFVKAGFQERTDYYILWRDMYKGLIKLCVMIEKDDNYLVLHMIDHDGTEYSPFWNQEYRSNDLVSEELIYNYNKFMDILVKKKILIEKEEENMFADGEIIQIKYVSDEIDKLVYDRDGKSDWIDLRSAQHVELKAGEFKLISLGVAMKLPHGYEAHIVPRSSTFKQFGIIQTNHQAVIDNSFCSDDDVWKYPAYALRDTVINVNDRICQFRIVKKQPKINFYETEHLDGVTRGGFGSTGRN